MKKIQERLQRAKMPRLSWRPFLRIVAITSLLVIWSVFAILYSPQEVVNSVAIGNGYISTSLVAFIGGISTFAAFPYYIVVFSFGAAGLSPILLGLCAGIGVAMGDTLSYILGYQGKFFFTPKRFKKIQTVILKFIDSYPGLMPLVLYLYGSLIPIPNDVLMVPLGIMRYPYWRAIIPFALGNITFNTAVAYIGFQIYYASGL